MLFVNVATGEYPRHPGDVALDPGAHWAEVVPAEWPSDLGERDYVLSDTVEVVDGIYHQRLVFATFTDEEWERQQQLGRLPF